MGTYSPATAVLHVPPPEPGATRRSHLPEPPLTRSLHRRYHDRDRRARALVAPPVREEEQEGGGDARGAQRARLGLHRRQAAHARALDRVVRRRVRADADHVGHRRRRHGRERPRRRRPVRGLGQAQEHQLQEDLGVQACKHAASVLAPQHQHHQHLPTASALKAAPPRPKYLPRHAPSPRPYPYTYPHHPFNVRFFRLYYAESIERLTGTVAARCTRCTLQAARACALMFWAGAGGAPLQAADRRWPPGCARGPFRVPACLATDLPPAGTASPAASLP